MVSLSKFNTNPSLDYSTLCYNNANFKNFKYNLANEAVSASFDDLNFVDYPVRTYAVTWFIRFREAIYGSYQYNPLYLENPAELENPLKKGAYDEALGAKFKVTFDTDPEIYTKLVFSDTILRNYLFPQTVKVESLGAIMFRLHNFEDNTNYTNFYNTTHF